VRASCDACNECAGALSEKNRRPAEDYDDKLVELVDVPPIGISHYNYYNCADSEGIMPRLLVLLVLFGLGLTATHGSAQQRVPHYIRTPRVSPYLQLFRGNTGGLNSYYSFVRPLQEQNQFMQMQLNRNQTVQAQIQQGMGMGTAPIQLEVADLQQALQLQVRSPAGGRAFVPGSFMNFSHFYGQAPVGPAGSFVNRRR